MVAVAITTSLTALLLIIAVTDARELRIPDLYNAALLAGGLGATLVLEHLTVTWAATSAAVALALFWALAHMYGRARGRPGLGFGDVKLIGASAAWIGLEGLPTMVLWGSLAALSAVAATAIAVEPVRLSDRIPFGPFLALGLWLVWVFGPL